MIEVRELTKVYNKQFALRNLELSIEPGKCLCILGPNGAGKSTFMRILATLSRPNKGDILFEGESIFSEPAVFRKKIGLIGHATFLYPELTAGENLKFYATLYQIPDAQQRIDDLLQTVGLMHRKDDRVRTFSRGMQQRLAIARAILNDPEHLFLDEPYTGLDQSASQLLTDRIIELKSAHRTIVLITHNLQQGYQLADKIVIFKDGRVADEAVTSAISESDFQQRYLAITSGGVN
ncbi:MAG: heme ABC exporter ATP-binding protein CcmA [Calditrichaeota bacterium]|nr:MAG: heme ABC exporter ATP-binding protein CcmA [Calditrichota bacterium]